MRRELQYVLSRLGVQEHYITSIKLSPDWRYATIYSISAIDEDDTASAKALEGMSEAIGKLLKERCSGHFFPKLRFRADATARQEQKLEELMRNTPDASAD